MRKLLLLILILSLLISCKSTKASCDAYGKVDTTSEMSV